MHTGGTAERQDRFLESFHIFTDIAFTGVIAHMFSTMFIVVQQLFILMKISPRIFVILHRKMDYL